MIFWFSFTFALKRIAVGLAIENAGVCVRLFVVCLLLLVVVVVVVVVGCWLLVVVVVVGCWLLVVCCLLFVLNCVSGVCSDLEIQQVVEQFSYMSKNYFLVLLYS